MATSRQIRLLRRPKGMPVPEDFELVEVELPEIAEGQVELRGLILSVDPAMRPRLNQEQPIGGKIFARGIAEVVRSRNPDFKEGQIVRHASGMQEQFLSDGADLTLLDADPDLSLTVYTHVLGWPGLTAYGGLLEVGRLREGEQIFVSAAAGAVGSVASQIARIKGCRVAGSAGGEEKRRWLRDVAKLDAAIDYRAAPIAETLAAAMPDGIDIYFDNVGGSHLDAALPLMNEHGRVALCGTISSYNGEGEGVKNLFSMIYSRVSMRGFITPDLFHLQERFMSDMTGWLKSGEIQYQETVLTGIERAPEGLIGLLKGENLGKMLIRLAP